jgi:K+/H+ antiporter YhaU regulatory subunit KhtT
MKQTVVTAQYLRIALDLATRIANGELKEGTKIYGRSMMASEYGVSPETIRRALRLLSDMKVVEVKPQSGSVVLSADNAKRYINNFSERSDTKALRVKLRETVNQYNELNKQINAVASALLKSERTFISAIEPFPNYEVVVPADSPLIGKNIGSLKFWQCTGATIVAIRRGQTVILSPGPFAELYGGDVVIFVGTPSAAEAAHRFVREKELIE